MDNNYKLWKGLAGALIVLCTPLGLYTCYQGIQMDKYVKISDYDNADKCLNNIKLCWKITGVVYAIGIVVSIFAS